MLAVVVSDTHIKRGLTRRLPDALLPALESADVILHGGDVVVGEVLEALRSFAPVHAVLGNNDEAALADVLPEELELSLGGVAVAMIHDSGPSKGREGRMHRRFPTADVVVFGHSHIPMCVEGVDGQLLLNPGSPTERRRQPFDTYGVLDVADGRVRRAEVVELR